MRDKRAWKLLLCQRKFYKAFVWWVWGVEKKGLFKYALFIYWYNVDGHEIYQATTMTMVWKSELSRQAVLHHKTGIGKTCVCTTNESYNKMIEVGIFEFIKNI